MRKHFYVLLISMLVLAGCATGGDDDTPTNQTAAPTPEQVSPEESPEAQDSQPPTATFIPPPPRDDPEDPVFDEPTPPPAPTFRNAEGTLIPIEEVTQRAVEREAIPTLGAQDVEAPPPGEIGRVSTVAPPEADDAPLTGFDYIYFEQIGGPNDITLRFEVYSDGRINFFDDTPPSTATQGELDRVAGLIDEVDFFNIQSTFVGAAPDSDNDYRYRLAVVNGSTQRAIQAQDGFIPPEIIRLLSAVRGLVEDVPGFLATAEAPLAETTPEATP